MSRPPGEPERAPDYGSGHASSSPAYFGAGSSSNVSASSAHDVRSPYEQVSSAPTQRPGNLPSVVTYWENPQPQHARQSNPWSHDHNTQAYQHDDPVSPESPIDVSGLQFALPPNIFQTSPPQAVSRSDTPSAEAFEAMSTAYYDDHQHLDTGSDSDRVPLTTSAEPISGTLSATPAEAQSRNSFQTIRDLDSSPSRGRDTTMLGYDLEPGYTPNSRHQSYGNALLPEGANRRSRSTSTSGAFQRTASIMRAMSQRVVDISGGGEALEQQALRERSRSPSEDGRRSYNLPASMLVDTSYPSQNFGTPREKKDDAEFVVPQPPPPPDYRQPMPSPLRGKSLGVFSADNPIRLWCCDLLMLPWMESLILILIVLQAVLLAVEAAPDVWSPGHARPDRWGKTPYDWAMLGLFVVFTLEIIMRVIVSGFVFNAPEYSTIDRKKGIRQGVRAAVADQYRSFFQPQRQKSVRRPPVETYGPSTFARSLTLMQGQHLPETYEEQQRMQLARRAFLRHSFNRLDFVAVVSFWISFVLGITGIEYERHIYLFRMLSCLRIVRLLSITKGNAIILRSLKKAAPLLVRVSFLIGFFWLLFAIIGVQSFKSSLSRQCVWLDPTQPDNLSAAYTNAFGFCGGHLKNDTNPEPTKLPWVMMPEPGNLNILRNGTRNGKGFICPRGSICLQQDSPYNNTVNFDNILHSLELVFVIMSANTFSDLMYYTTDSDYLAAALFFAAGIMIMMLWMTNLLIAVITSSFQVIREESKGSAFTADEGLFLAPRPDNPLRRTTFLKRVYSKISWLWVCIIAYDLVAQAFRSAAHGDRIRLINTSEIVVTILLDVEICIRFAADWRHFHHGLQNLVDFSLAVITSVILIPPIHNADQVYAWLTVFQLLRAYRVVLAIPMTRALIRRVLGNATGIGNLMLFVFLITFLMAIFAVQLFRGEITPQDENGDNIEITFASIFNSFLGMYQILSSENWTAVLYVVTGFTTGLKTSWIGAIFLIGWFILSYFILVNMFIAVIQENFDVGEDQKRLEQVKAFLQRKELGSSASNLTLSAMFSLGRRPKRKDPFDYGPAMMEMLLKEVVVREFLNEALDPLQKASPGEQSPPQVQEGIGAGVKPGALSAIWGKAVQMVSSRDPNPFYSNVRFDNHSENLDPRQMARQAVSATSARRKAQREYLSRHPTYNNALFIFTPRSPIRRLCQRLVGPGRGSERFDGVDPNKYAWYAFSAFIYACIVAMVVIACVTTPLYQKEYFDSGHTFSFKNWFVWTDLAFAVVFTVEAVIKIIADGFFWTPNAYFRSSWGIIDAVVLITLWINVATLFANDGAVSRAVGAFKALRALRLLNVSDSARNTFHSLIVVGGWKIISAAFVSISLLIPFAIYGLNLFRGQMVTCNDDGGAVVRLQDCTGEYLSTPFSSEWQLLSPRVAANPYFSFDDFGSSLLILFTIVSQEGWVDVSFQAQSITGIGKQPQFGAAQGNALFFVVFNLLATVFVLTLFISVFMRNYTEQTGVAFLTADQRAWLELRKLLRQISPSKSSYDDSKNRLKKWCHKRAIEKRGKWHLGITIVLVLHLILLVLEYSTEPDWWTDTRDYLFLFFTLIYMANITIRIVGLGWSRFRRSSWDIFSMGAVAGAFATSILFLAHPKQDTFIQLHKIFLVAIVLLLIPRNDALDQLFKTAAASLTTIGNLLATWIVFFLVFAIAMTQSFSLTRFGSQETNNINLRTVPNALILLFRMSCGEGWNQIMEDFATIEPPFCVEASTFFGSDCGSTAWARVLFIAWNIISMYIFVNLFVSLIYESFSYVYQRSSGLADINRDEIRRFKEAWRSVDPDGVGFISREDFPRLLGELSGVFEMRVYDQEDSVRSILDYVRNDQTTPQARHASLASQSALTGVNLQKLNERISQIDVNRVRERRRRFNIFYEEVMVSADPDKGISFTTVLMTLAHYNIISDSKSLRLEEFLRRRARLQRVEEEVRRRVVLGFFDTLYWSRKFRRHMDQKRFARMTDVPQLGIPDILVDDEDDRAAASENTHAEVPSSSRTVSSFLSAEDVRAANHHRSWSGASMDISLHDASYGHPLSAARTSGLPSPTIPVGLEQQQRHHNSGFSFELQEESGDRAEGASNDRRGSAVSPGLVREMLDDSVWVESIRRSATQRRGGWGT
ncbi:calcium channel subunit cch1 [Niveomyces insectorum RCEF 264]|uniref:Calcium-channel protein CCH1 n=1 Tax=Niveomyces insectorum RCEF 264 TaxID=1081102 RepID=A0A167U0U9_9HYPO|nr:calcium channel subunit cch1 [Niveomyces insectorum RCEF 264]